MDKPDVERQPMIRPQSIWLTLVGIGIAIVVAMATRVTWIMAAEGCIFMILCQVILSEANGWQDADDRAGGIFAGVIIVIAAIGLDQYSWWPLLHYGVPALAGMVFPYVAVRLSKDLAELLAAATTNG